MQLLSESKTHPSLYLPSLTCTPLSLLSPPPFIPCNPSSLYPPFFTPPPLTLPPYPSSPPLPSLPPYPYMYPLTPPYCTSDLGTVTPYCWDISLLPRGTIPATSSAQWREKLRTTGRKVWLSLSAWTTSLNMSMRRENPTSSLTTPATTS